MNAQQEGQGDIKSMSKAACVDGGACVQTVMHTSCANVVLAFCLDWSECGLTSCGANFVLPSYSLHQPKKPPEPDPTRNFPHPI